MANHAKDMQIVRSVLQLLQRNASQRSIPKQLAISRNTVRDYVAKCKASPYSLTELLAMDDATLSEIIYPGPSSHKPDQQLLPDPRKEHFEAQKEYLLKELGRKGVTRQLLWEEYRGRYSDGYGYSQFCERLRRYQRTKEVSMHFDYKPADLLMIDFAGDKLSYTDRDTGELIYCQVLVCVLPCSGFSYVEALPNASLPQLVKGLNNCLKYMGGAPLSLKADNMKQFVTRTCKYEPVFTDMITAWALHNNILLQAARVRKPRDKPHVENEVKITYSRIYAPLRNKVFHSPEELNKAIIRQLQLHHKRPFQKKDYNRLDLFSQNEQPLLSSLPIEPYVMKYTTLSKVQRNYHVLVWEDRHYYSVPYTYVGKTLRIVYDTDHVEVYHQQQRVALHRRSYKRYGHTTLPDHMPDAHRNYQEQRGWNKEYFLEQAARIGPHTRLYMERMINSRAIKEQTYNGCLGILRLSKSYPPERMEGACKRALLTNSTAYKTIQNILLNKLDGQDLNTGPQLSLSLPNHENLRGSEAYN